MALLQGCFLRSVRSIHIHVLATYIIQTVTQLTENEQYCQYLKKNLFIQFTKSFLLSMFMLVQLFPFSIYKTDTEKHHKIKPKFWKYSLYSFLFRDRFSCAANGASFTRLCGYFPFYFAALYSHTIRRALSTSFPIRDCACKGG
jgi:hypothetical protein